MLKVKDNGHTYKIVFDGDKENYNDFFILVTSIDDALKLKGEKGWKIPKCYLPEFENKFVIEKILTGLEDIGSGLKLEPYLYQKETIKYALENPKSLLILPCGAGKTPILVGVYHEYRKRGAFSAPGAIVVKASLKYQWVKEVEKFSDYRAKAIDSSKKAKKKFDAQFEDADLFILNYETLKDEEVVKKLREKNVQIMLFDEIHYINSYKSARSIAAAEFNDLPYISGATATPITNNPENLFGIFNVIEKDLFKSFGKFAGSYIKYAGFGRVAGCKNEEHLRDKISPYIFIKTEEEVADQLPELIVNEVNCTMPPSMKKINTQLFEELTVVQEEAAYLEKKFKTPQALEHNEEYLTAKGKIMAYQTFLQELVNDPRLLSESDSAMAKKYSCKDTSPKMRVLLDLIANIIDSGKKVCVFTRYVRMQLIIQKAIEDEFKKQKVVCAIVNGSTDSIERYKQVYEKFQHEDNCKVLIGTDAMAEGVSAYWCNYLIEYDLAESYAIQTQRHGRIKRANSVHATSHVYQIICLESWDEVQKKIISKKENYDQNLIQKLGRK